MEDVVIDRPASLALIYAPKLEGQGPGFFCYFDRNAQMQQAFEVVLDHVKTVRPSARGVMQWRVYPIDEDRREPFQRGIVAVKLNPL